jgi:hypothetical protein
MDRALLASKVEAAKGAVTDAEVELERLISDLRVMARAEKTTINAALESAFTKLRAARRDLEALEDVLAKDRVDKESTTTKGKAR